MCSVIGLCTHLFLAYRPLSGKYFVMVIRIFAYEVRKLGLIAYRTKYQSVIITDRCIELRSNCYLHVTKGAVH